MSPYRCVSHQIRSICDGCATRLVLGHLSTPVSSFSLPHPLFHTRYTDEHTYKHACKNKTTTQILIPQEEKQVASHPLCSLVISEGPVAGLGLHSFFVMLRRGQQWRRSRGRASGAPGARNVNWEDCFNKVLIFADAGSGLASGATQTGGQLTVRYCQQT